MKRGSLYSINLDAAAHPGIIVSNSARNDRLDSVVIVPLSSRPPEISPVRLRVDLRGLRTSYAVIPGIRQVSKARLHDPIGITPAAAMDRIDEALAAYLGD